MPNRFAAYGEYADAFRFTAVVKLDGRSGSVGWSPGAVDIVDVVLVGIVELAPDDPAPALSHGFGGDGVAIFWDSSVV